MDFVTPTGFPVVFEYAEIVTSTAVAAAALLARIAWRGGSHRRHSDVVDEEIQG